jgi:hypothetical protein
MNLDFLPISSATCTASSLHYRKTTASSTTWTKAHHNKIFTLRTASSIVSVVVMSNMNTNLPLEDAGKRLFSDVEDLEKLTE